LYQGQICIATNRFLVNRNGISGSVAAIFLIDNEKGAIGIANDFDFGLSGAVYSGSLKCGIHLAKQIITCMINGNDQTINIELEDHQYLFS
jgi:acyl-CoA reductase-like NAD-dependent aldehyde dehydrogenase